MSQVNKISKNNTTVVELGESTVITLHSTPIVTIEPETITLNTGGWNTATTRTRMNQASNEMDLGYKVSMKGGQFIVRYHGVDHVVPGSLFTLNR